MKRLILGTFIIGCFVAFSGEISDYHLKHAPQSLPDLFNSKHFKHKLSASTKHGITEIGIERTACFGVCPIYTFIVKSDGTFRYKGEKYVDRKGDFTGRISVWDFNNLAEYIKDSGYMKLKDDYSRPVTDSATTYTMVVMNSKRKTLSNYDDSGPKKLWAIETMIDGLMATAQWDASEKSTIPKK